PLDPIFSREISASGKMPARTWHLKTSVKDPGPSPRSNGRMMCLAETMGCGSGRVTARPGGERYTVSNWTAEQAGVSLYSSVTARIRRRPTELGVLICNRPARRVGKTRLVDRYHPSVLGDDGDPPFRWRAV